MADENILSSPRKLNSSIHRSRLRRKHKRLNATFTKTPEPPPDNATTFHKIKNTSREEDLSCTLLVMYDSEEDGMEEECRVADNVLAKVKENYDPFAEQRLLVLADRLAAPSRRSHNFTATQGFQPCHNFLNQFTEICPEKHNAVHSTKKVEVEITDSELLQVCIETEQSTTNSAINIKQESPEVNQPTNTLTTPQCQQKPKSIVDLILEDFCSSPTSPELKQSSEESNFQFRFANKPLRTYSKRRNSSLTARQNIAVQYEQPANSRCPIDDDLLSNGSSTDLSVQEDQTQMAFRTDVEEVVELQHSQSLCENLQNLSAYFTELSGEEVRNETKTLAAKREQSTSKECEELVKITVDKSSGNCTAMQEDISNLQEDENQEIMETPPQCPASHCENLSSEEEDNFLKDEQKEIVFENTQLQCSNSLNGYISNDEDFRGFGSEEEDVSVVKKTASKQNCDKMVLNDEDANSLTDKDDWYEECDIFANLNMEAALDATTSYKLQPFNQSQKMKSSIVAQINVEPNIGFRTASNREVKISTEAKARASAILQDLAPLDNSYIPGQDMEADENEDCQKNMNQTFALTKSAEELNLSPAVQKQQQHTYSNPPLNLKMPAFVGFATASNKKITISKEAETKAAKILEQLPPISPSEEINITKKISIHTAPKEEYIFKGFCTASSKEVKISAEAKARASAILQDLTTLDSSYIPGRDMAAVENKDCQNDKNQTFAITKSYHQELNRSPAVQQHQHKYSNPPLNLNGKYSGHTAEEKEMPAFVGFATASNKKITISKEAETKAAKILEQLPPISPSEEINITKQISMHTAPKEEYIFKGFCTASSKEIKISKEAQERALKLLEQLPDLEVKEEQDMHKMTGFRTASRKTVQISEDAKKRAALIMKEVMDFDADIVEHNAEECLDNIQFSEWPVEEKEVQEDVMKIDAKSSDMKIGSDANMPGFSTASNKTIKISEAAMQRAAGILEDLPELSTDEVIKCPNTAKNMDTETLQNMMFSEWPLDDVVGDALDKHETPPNGMHKRKRNTSDNPATHDALQAHSPQTPKFICTSPSKERSPLTNIQTAVARSSLSELAIKTPPDYRACRGIISRKNLLSLNKRNKLSAKSLQQNKEFKDDCSTVSTPKNRRRRSIPSIGNDIKSPPGTPIPNLQEFFQSATVSTSTPHPPAREQTQMRTRGRKRTELQLAASNASTKDVSFKRIEWENESLNKTAASLNASRLSNSSFSNIIKMESNPTPKQRIERLRMYGKPPSVSPILMSSTNNCRISGLKRRTRSANKVDEVNKE